MQDSLNEKPGHGRFRDFDFLAPSVFAFFDSVFFPAVLEGFFLPAVGLGGAGFRSLLDFFLLDLNLEDADFRSLPDESLSVEFATVGSNFLLRRWPF